MQPELKRRAEPPLCSHRLPLLFTHVYGSLFTFSPNLVSNLVQSLVKGDTDRPSLITGISYVLADPTAEEETIAAALEVLSSVAVSEPSAVRAHCERNKCSPKVTVDPTNATKVTFADGEGVWRLNSSHLPSYTYTPTPPSSPNPSSSPPSPSTSPTIPKYCGDLLFTLSTLLVTAPSGLLLTITSLLASLLDPETMEGSQSAREGFLTSFYDCHVDWLLVVLNQGDELRKGSAAELIWQCVRMHDHRMKFFILKVSFKWCCGG